MVAWKSSTGVDALTQRSSVAGPDDGGRRLVNGAVWKPMPSAAGTGVQSQSGSAAHAFPPGGRLVGGRARGSRVNEALATSAGAASRANRPRRSRASRTEPAGGQVEKSAE